MTQYNGARALLALLAVLSVVPPAGAQYALPQFNCSAVSSKDSSEVAGQYARMLQGTVAGAPVTVMLQKQVDVFTISRGSNQVTLALYKDSLQPVAGADYKAAARLQFFRSELQKTNSLAFFTSAYKGNVDTLRNLVLKELTELELVRLSIKDDAVVLGKVELVERAIHSPTTLAPGDAGYPRGALANELAALQASRESTLRAMASFTQSPSLSTFSAFESSLAQLFAHPADLEASKSAYLGAVQELKLAILSYANDNPDKISPSDASNLAKRVEAPFDEVQFASDIVSPLLSFEEEFWNPRVASAAPTVFDALERSISLVAKEFAAASRAACAQVPECSGFTRLKNPCPSVSFAVNDLVLSPDYRELWVDSQGVALLEGKWAAFLAAMESRDYDKALALVDESIALSRRVLNAGIQGAEQPVDYTAVAVIAVILALAFLFLRGGLVKPSHAPSDLSLPADWTQQYGK